jgi:DNA modification methylase
MVFLQTVTPTVHPRKVNTKYKPILIFQNVPAGEKVRAHDRYFVDVIEGKQVEKDAHEWQQSADGLEKLIDTFTNVGDLILEPFSGGGTTALVARMKERRCIAFEVDEKAFKASVGRVFADEAVAP